LSKGEVSLLQNISRPAAAAPESASNEQVVVLVVDDDSAVREGLSELLEAHGLRVAAYASAGDYARAPAPTGPACLLLDIELPDINGLELQSQLAGADHPPIVFITGHGDIPSSVRAIKRGAVDFLTKPFGEDALLAAVDAALAQDDRVRAERADLEILRDRYAQLTPRERQVLPLIVSGLMNKQAAAELGLSEVTLQVHRRNVLRKMGAQSLADLVRTAERLQIPVTHSRRREREA
jgi:FixJ family two-component response regulator